ncbi:MAG: prepilin-type N-terminal cleavage/methylation domain-containing protein [Candidatus Riflebacteria bacterium]|nr:prepilin-type N-terminal cleavage/methylation domain-containing protein [Candidatus Riflebacteria bacterium]
MLWSERLNFSLDLENRVPRGPLRDTRAVTLLEVLVALAILSSILLPIFMFLIEYLKGSSELGDSHQVMNLLEEKMEIALTKPFQGFAMGKYEDKAIIYDGREILDLRPNLVGALEVHFSLKVDAASLDFSAIKDAKSGKLERASIDDAMKKLTLRAVWGKKKEHFSDLVAFKGDL